MMSVALGSAMLPASHTSHFHLQVPSKELKVHSACDLGEGACGR